MLEKNPIPQDVVDNLLDSLADALKLEPVAKLGEFGPTTASRRLFAITMANNLPALRRWLRRIEADDALIATVDDRIRIVARLLAQLGVDVTEEALHADEVEPTTEATTLGELPILDAVRPPVAAPFRLDERDGRIRQGDDSIAEAIDEDAVRELLRLAELGAKTEWQPRWKIVIGGPGARKGAQLGRAVQVFVDGQRMPHVVGCQLDANVNDVVRLHLEVMPTELEIVTDSPPDVVGVALPSPSTYTIVNEDGQWLYAVVTSSHVTWTPHKHEAKSFTDVHEAIRTANEVDGQIQIEDDDDDNEPRVDLSPHDQAIVDDLIANGPPPGPFLLRRADVQRGRHGFVFLRLGDEGEPVQWTAERGKATRWPTAIAAHDAMGDTQASVVAFVDAYLTPREIFAKAVSRHSEAETEKIMAAARSAVPVATEEGLLSRWYIDGNNERQDTFRQFMGAPIDKVNVIAPDGTAATSILCADCGHSAHNHRARAAAPATCLVEGCACLGWSTAKGGAL